MSLSAHDISADVAEQHPIFSFANGEMGAFSSGFIRALERVTGQPKIKKLYVDYVDDNRPNELFWTDALHRLNISPDLSMDGDFSIPKTGRVLIISNHPYGVVDGLVLCSLVSQVRQDYRIITHQVLRQAPAVMDKILPIDFAETDTALATNLETRKHATNHLKDEGVVIIFPAGGISLAPNFVGKAYDSEWKTFAARLSTMEQTTILPFYFHGRNSIVYQVARRLSMTLGYSLMFREICHQMDKAIKLTLRKPVISSELAHFTNRSDVTDFLRKRTYGEL
jgi:putative hemolysin